MGAALLGPPFLPDALHYRAMTDWFQLGSMLHQQRLAQIEAAKPQVQAKMATGPEDAPGYRFLGVVYFTFPHPLYPVDPDAVRAMKEFCPDYVPMWGRWYFLEEARDSESFKEVYFDRHMIARRVKDPRLSHAHMFGTLGAEAKGWLKGRPYRAQIVGPEPVEGWPNYLEGHWHYTRDKGLPHPDIPGDFAPHGMEVVRFLEETMVRPKPDEDVTQEAPVASWRARVDDPIARRKKREASEEAVNEARDKEMRAYTQKQMDRAGSDWDRQVVEHILKPKFARFNLGGGKQVAIPLPALRLPKGF